MEVMEPCTGWHPPDGSAAWRKSAFPGVLSRQNYTDAAVFGLTRIRTTALCSIYCKKNGFVYCGVIHLANGAPRLAFERAAVALEGAYAGMQNPNGMNPEEHMQGRRMRME